MLTPQCPLCQWPTPTLLRSIETTSLIDLWRRTFEMDITSELKGVERIQLFDCDRCHLQFFHPIDLAGSEQLYAQLAKFPWYYMWRWEHDVALRELRGCDSLLEVGCGFGDFVARARQSGIQAEGIDLSTSAVRTAQQRGVPVERLELSALAAQRPGAYAAVCSFQVLEHVTNPWEFLDWSCTLLKPGGRLIVCVPNAQSFLQYRFDALDMPPHHVSRWSALTMQTLGDRLPIRLEQVHYEPLPVYHVYGYVQAQGAARIKSRWLRRLFDAVIVPGASLALRPERFRRSLIGQVLYASFRRV